MKSHDWNVQSSSYAKNTFNPIRHIIENLKISPNKDKPMIALSIGDPTVFGNLLPAPEIIEAVINVLKEGNCNGYAPSIGFESARAAVAEFCTTPEAPLHAKDIILCSGCSSSLEMCITVMCSPGQNILVPRPGFPLYETLAKGLGINVKYYDLLPEKQWQINLEMMEGLIDNLTRAIVINNPSNPCGSVFSKEHLLNILKIAEKNRLPIIADEIYAGFVFRNQEFHWLASLTTEVPILSCAGLTKRWLIPGWRMGWIAIHDRNGIFAKELRHGLHSLSQRVIGSNTLVQGALPAIFKNTPQSFYNETLADVESNAKLCYNLIKRIPGLKPIMPQGAMYMMVHIEMEHFPKFQTDLEFVENLISEQSVFCLPGKCFGIPNYVRLVLTVPTEETIEACERIKEFCIFHCAKINGTNTSTEDETDKIYQNRHKVVETHQLIGQQNDLKNGVNSSIAGKKKVHPFVRGSSFDVINNDDEEELPLITYKNKVAPMKKLIKSNSIAEDMNDEEN